MRMREKGTFMIDRQICEKSTGGVFAMLGFVVAARTVVYISVFKSICTKLI
jgi:hypothetical protein